MSNSVQCIDNLLTTFDRDISLSSDTKIHNSTAKCDKTPCNKLLNGTHHSTQTQTQSNTTNNIDTTSFISSTSETIISNNNEKAKPSTPPPPQASAQEDDTKNDDQKEELNEKDLDDLTEEEALRLAMELSMNEDDRKLVFCIEKEIREAQGHLSNWFSGNFKSVQDKNRAWCSFCKRLHHQFEMYRIENGVIQPLSYQFFIQFIALMYGTMKTRKADDASIDQHKIRNIYILSPDDDAIKYLRFAQGISRKEVTNAVYAKFESLALDPMSPDEWKFNHVMFIRSQKAPNGLLWTKWHMQ